MDNVKDGYRVAAKLNPRNNRAQNAPRYLHAAMPAYRKLMVEATVPTEGLPAKRSNQAKKFIDSYLTLGETNSQRLLREHKHLCMCPPLRHCGKTATLHTPPCDFCHGPPPEGPPFFLRYYPTDDGWWTLRHQVKRIRQAVGMDDFEDVIPTSHP